jgi:hypothetical protein
MSNVQQPERERRDHAAPPPKAGGRRRATIAAAIALLAAAPLAVAVTVGGCTSTASASNIGCTTYTPDAGTTPDVTCSIGWNCNSDTAQFAILCVADGPEYYRCTCSDGTTNTRTIVVDTFICDGEGSLSPANQGCEFNISM